MEVAFKMLYHMFHLLALNKCIYLLLEISHTLSLSHIHSLEVQDESLLCTFIILVSVQNIVADGGDSHCSADFC